MKSPDPVDIHVGARIRYRRMALGMSQDALAKRLGVTFQQVQKYEKGQNRVGASRLWRIACELGAPVEFFFRDIAREPGRGRADGRGAGHGVDPMRFVASAEGLQLNLAFLRVQDAETRRKIVELVSTLAADSAIISAKLQ